MTEPLEFPHCHCHIGLARDETGTVIGVQIHFLVLTEDVPRLTGGFKEGAQAMLYDHAVRCDDKAR